MISRSFISWKSRPTPSSFVEFTRKEAYQQSTTNTKKRSLSQTIWNGSSRPLPMTEPQPIRKKLVLLLQERSAQLRNQRIVEKRSSSSPPRKTSVSSAERLDIGRRIVQTQRNLSSYVLSINCSLMLKKKNLPKHLFRRVRG